MEATREDLEALRDELHAAAEDGDETRIKDLCAEIEEVAGALMGGTPGKTKLSAGWEEAKHDRADDGKFAPEGGAGGGGYESPQHRQNVEIVRKLNASPTARKLTPKAAKEKEDRELHSKLAGMPRDELEAFADKHGVDASKYPSDYNLFQTILRNPDARKKLLSGETNTAPANKYPEPPPISEGLYKEKNEEGRAYKIAQGFKWNGEGWEHPDYPGHSPASSDVPRPKAERVREELAKIRGGSGTHTNSKGEEIKFTGKPMPPPAEGYKLEGTCVSETQIADAVGGLDEFEALIEENGDEFEHKGTRVTYNPKTREHFFWRKPGAS